MSQMKKRFLVRRKSDGMFYTPKDTFTDKLQFAWFFRESGRPLLGDGGLELVSAADYYDLDDSHPF